MTIRAAIPLLFGLCGCRDLPDYPVPGQRPSFENFQPHTSAVVEMSDPGAPLRFVRDIADKTDTTWRWTEQRPAVKAKLGLRTEVNYIIDFTIPGATFRETGPVTIAFTVNGHLLDRVRYPESGLKHFEKPVPPEWLEPAKDAIVGAEIDKMWVSKQDGERLGFIITRMGLAPR